MHDKTPLVPLVPSLPSSALLSSSLKGKDGIFFSVGVGGSQKINCFVGAFVFEKVNHHYMKIVMAMMGL